MPVPVDPTVRAHLLEDQDSLLMGHCWGLLGSPPEVQQITRTEPSVPECRPGTWKACIHCWHTGPQDTRTHQAHSQLRHALPIYTWSLQYFIPMMISLDRSEMDPSSALDTFCGRLLDCLSKTAMPLYAVPHAFPGKGLVNCDSDRGRMLRYSCIWVSTRVSTTTSCWSSMTEVQVLFTKSWRFCIGLIMLESARSLGRARWVPWLCKAFWSRPVFLNRWWERPLYARQTKSNGARLMTERLHTDCYKWFQTMTIDLYFHVTLEWFALNLQGRKEASSRMLYNGCILLRPAKCMPCEVQYEVLVHYTFLETFDHSSSRGFDSKHLQLYTVLAV